MQNLQTPHSTYSFIKAELVEARNKPLENYSYKFLSPVEKIGEPKTHAPWENSTCPILTIRLMDIINKSGKSEKPIFRKIVEKGGIRPYLGFNGNIILSSVMPDQTIFGMTPERHADIINAIKPDYYFTPDGETYTGEEYLSLSEIGRMLEETKVLQRRVSCSKPIGLAKGCTIEQIKSHTESLKALGIDDFVFHTGDFLEKGSAREITKAKVFAREVRKVARTLMVYGIGTGNLKNFWYADAFITQSHYLNALSYGQIITDEGLVNDGRPTANREVIMNNLSKFDEIVISMQDRKLG